MISMVLSLCRECHAWKVGLTGTEKEAVSSEEIIQETKGERGSSMYEE